MIIGFTGTQVGLTPHQTQMLWTLLAAEGIEEFHHGDCVGADAQAHAMAVGLGIPVIIHPCTIEAKRAYCEGAREVLEAKAPLDRNRDIVDACDGILACPRGPEEQRSGTWATVRYARNPYKPLTIIYSNGRVVAET